MATQEDLPDVWRSPAVLTLCLCTLINSAPIMFDRMQAHWLNSYPAGTTVVDGVQLTSPLHYQDLTGDANFDGRIDMNDFNCISQNWPGYTSPLQPVADQFCPLMSSN